MKFLDIVEKISRALVVIVALVGLGVLIGISISRNDVQAANTEKRLYNPYISWDYVKGALVVDSQTGVEYWLLENRLTVLVDKDGKPVIYKGE